ncbi:Exocyst complex subunit Exo70, C-terminal [Dillenia turbinata]|uniref:Exocyst subunit Exo70 family protein n=1 Tax=Dillenia turbinata TaxID=194707 RepID=A0AAN8V7W3_9MAGN
MGDDRSVVLTSDQKGHLIAAVQHIMKALELSVSLPDDLRENLAALGTLFSPISVVNEAKGDEMSDIEQRLKCIQKKISGCDSKQSMIWDAGPDEALDYLQAVEEVRRIAQVLGNSSFHQPRKQQELVNQVHIILHMAMSRLEEEFIHILVKNKQFFEPEFMSFRSNEGCAMYDESFELEEDYTVEDAVQRQSSHHEPEVYSLDLVHPDAVPALKAIANMLVESNYDRELCLAFIRARKEALIEYLTILEVEKLSIEDVLNMEWNCSNCMIRRWIWVLKIIVRVYLASEKRLCDKILRDFGPISMDCFLEISKAPMMCLLNFGDAVAIGPHTPEKLFMLLNMYEVLLDLVPDVNSLFSEEVGCFIRTEFHELLKKLGDSAIATFLGFGNIVASRTSKNPFPKGGVHPLTSYCMNYINALTAYSSTINTLLGNKEQNESVHHFTTSYNRGGSSGDFSPMTYHLKLIISDLEANLDARSKLYSDDALKHIFLMNNTHYMVKKIQGSDLLDLFGGEWVRDHIRKFQQHATSYQRATWSSILFCLREDGLEHSSQNLRATLKEVFKSFNTSFEEVYKIQTGWLVSDRELREHLRLVTSQRVILAYRAFIGRSSNHVGDKFIKYTVDELENFLLDLFEGTSKSSQNFRKGKR